ncbi:hypothetical protein ACWEK5_18545 [Rhodococcus koreensis]|uniref:hypothetical protein n=1 Tax=Rhodococcus sp. T2V TaxID=3034164 RepID=UPI0023E0FB30|nr:hypothetical protein [Rhodococcus sp. T2V]MDF3312758.1 hypothetical protein [Rhodococcus sp. T2V]
MKPAPRERRLPTARQIPPSNAEGRQHCVPVPEPDVVTWPDPSPLANWWVRVMFDADHDQRAS